MAIESAEDRKTMIEIFGETCTVGGLTVSGIYDDPHFETMEISTSTPMLTVITVDVPAVKFGDAVSVPSSSFTGTISDIQPDGTGVTVLILKV